MNDTGISPVVFPFFFVALWLLVSALIAVMGGWTSLATSYPAPEGFRVDSFFWTRWVDVTLRDEEPALRLYGDPGDAVWGEWRVRAQR